MHERGNKWKWIQFNEHPKMDDRQKVFVVPFEPIRHWYRLGEVSLPNVSFKLASAAKISD